MAASVINTRTILAAKLTTTSITRQGKRPHLKNYVQSQLCFPEVRRRGFSTSDNAAAPEGGTNAAPRETATVVLLRHGQSTWNKIPTFSGWCDVPLTDKGIEQAAEAGALLYNRNYHFDLCYTSTLKRAYKSADVVLQTMQQLEQQERGDDHEEERRRSAASTSVPVIKAWQLNERHYGELQGQAKSSPFLHEKYGTEQITAWRRDMHARPPAMSEAHPYYEGPPAPLTESLYDSQQRVLKYWKETIVPSLTSDGQDSKHEKTRTGRSCPSILIVAHANTIRGLVASLDGIADEDVPKIHIANSVPLVYQIDPDTGEAVSTNNSPYSLSKGQWILSSQNQERLLEKLGPDSEAFARSVFEAWDLNRDGILSRTELAIGLSAWKSDPNPAINALAGKVVEELLNLETEAIKDNGRGITMEMLQSVTVAGCRKHNLPFFEADEVSEPEVLQRVMV